MAWLPSESHLRFSLGTLFFACQLADLLWPTLLLLGLETVDIRPGDTVVTPLAFSPYPYSHSLLGLLLWGLLLALAWRMRHATTRGAIVLVAVVVSHWVLDGLTHRPDMPISFTGANRVGLGLWNSLPWTVAVEALMFVAALAMYTRTTRPLDRIGSVGFWALIVTLVLVYIANLAGPVPSSTRYIAWGAQALWVPVVWSFWVDRHRTQAG